MLLVRGNALMKRGKYDDAIQSFKDAREKPRRHSSRALSLVSLVSFLMSTLQCIEIPLNL